MIQQPFPIGATIFHKQWGDTVVITAYTDKGFAYKGAPRTDVWAGEPIHFTGEGECYEAGFDSWELYTGNNKITPFRFRSVLLPKDDDCGCGHCGASIPSKLELLLESIPGYVFFVIGGIIGALYMAAVAYLVTRH